MLCYDSPADFPKDRLMRRVLLTILLTGLREKADRVEFRYDPNWLSVWCRADDAWFEMIPPPRDCWASLIAEVRRLSRLVAPERGGWQAWLSRLVARRSEPAAGWMTLRLRGRYVLYAVRLDPSPEYGLIVFELIGPTLEPEVIAAVFDKLSRSGPMDEIDDLASHPQSA